MKSLSNMIPFDFVLKLKFDGDFIFKTMSKKKVSISGGDVLAFMVCGVIRVVIHTYRRTCTYTYACTYVCVRWCVGGVCAWLRVFVCVHG